MHRHLFRAKQVHVDLFRTCKQTPFDAAAAAWCVLPVLLGFAAVVAADAWCVHSIKVRSHGAAVAMLVLVFFIALPLKVFT